ncbi:energy transducer TonB [Neotamlana laminarinivorans]|uniref:Energy transducer TonB n=1 Tax=Neotamlana laminarinivorans TaxID=2883124 RepID=A0A9X1I4I6_9FLAO|nr:energy transducer TonB [Tamlana laminarinivorans]MCB4800072.1 energy transducer TonB [Tamlana laminarinivorans]
MNKNYLTQKKHYLFVMLLIILIVPTTSAFKPVILNSDEIIEFYSADNVPLFKGCERSGSRKEDVACFNEKITKHIKRNFVYPEEAYRKKIEGRVWVTFIIDNAGKVKDIKANEPNHSKTLEDEAVRIVSLLRKFTPGVHNGKIVNVKYGMPITFKLH